MTYEFLLNTAVRSLIDVWRASSVQRLCQWLSGGGAAQSVFPKGVQHENLRERAIISF